MAKAMKVESLNVVDGELVDTVIRASKYCVTNDGGDKVTIRDLTVDCSGLTVEVLLEGWWKQKKIEDQAKCRDLTVDEILDARNVRSVNWVVLGKAIESPSKVRANVREALESIGVLSEEQIEIALSDDAKVAKIAASLMKK